MALHTSRVHAAVSGAQRTHANARIAYFTLGVATLWAAALIEPPRASHDVTKHPRAATA